MHNIFGKKEILHCTVCNKELARHKYRPAKEWKMEGVLCADCHIEKTKEFMLLQQQEESAPELCAICRREIKSDEDRNKPRWQWDMESGSLVCRECYQKKDTDHSKKMNFCSSCNSKLGMFYYHPKTEWKIEGNLCRKCWDEQNGRGVH